jgi:inner membrane protein
MALCPSRRPWTWLLPASAVAGIALLDAAARSRPWPVPIAGALDEPAHLATAWLVLCAVAPRDVPPWFWRTALVAAVAIDVDHVAMYATGGRFAVDGGRPPTHCLALVVLTAAVGLLGPRARWALGAAAGMLLHFVRDVATGPGVALLWPVSDTAVEVPHAVYLGAVALLALLAVGRRRFAGTRSLTDAADPPQAVSVARARATGSGGLAGRG